MGTARLCCASRLVGVLDSPRGALLGGRAIDDLDDGIGLVIAGRVV